MNDVNTFCQRHNDGPMVYQVGRIEKVESTHPALAIVVECFVKRMTGWFEIQQLMLVHSE